MKLLTTILLLITLLTLTSAHPDKPKPPKPPSKCDDYPCRSCCTSWSICIQKCSFFHTNPRRCTEQCQDQKCKGEFEFCKTECHFDHCEPDWADDPGVALTLLPFPFMPPPRTVDAVALEAPAATAVVSVDVGVNVGEGGEGDDDGDVDKGGVEGALVNKTDVQEVNATKVGVVEVDKVE
ncbi:hypothetical protein P153DRAFT_389784 [Dothidotthia symphoricarpi CBS 119687]|uniref:Uncharacterized protein n=1 Tax=Dothidotthia symphoricarpi CBS 119687 TaxID=1392245 RepID=A0A6A6A076_9PLEO|nr:uncharacterized protein P153DRAFT_389784 [Dothidotthia symphoricarpi CBS 119687]KAF2124926.1 hypothetical protein P153DRAFT_389784 [Dothidotthia symphoricarpi CBS 119687]